MTDEALFHHTYHRHRSSEEDREGAEQVTGSDVNARLPRLPLKSLLRHSFLRLLHDGLAVITNSDICNFSAVVPTSRWSIIKKTTKQCSDLYHCSHSTFIRVYSPLGQHVDQLND